MAPNYECGLSVSVPKQLSASLMLVLYLCSIMATTADRDRNLILCETLSPSLFVDNTKACTEQTVDGIISVLLA